MFDRLQLCVAPYLPCFDGFRSLDGYLGFYPLEYKGRFRKVIAPSLEKNQWARDYYDGWGARVCLYSGDDENTYAPLRVMELNDNDLYVDMDELKSLDCRYIFSRIELGNADELGLSLIGTYTKENSPYTIYVYGL